MKKLQCFTLFFIISLSATLNIEAHEQSGSLGDVASSTDIYAVICEEGSTKVYFDFYGSLPKGSPTDLIISAQILSGQNTLTITDPNSSDRLPSRGEEIQSDGLILLVNKNKAGKANFTLNYHCQAASGDHTGTEISQIQNQ